METYLTNGKNYAKTSDLTISTLNEKLRLTETKDYQRLINDLEKYGELGPLLVNSGKHWGKAGEVIGGNTRLRVYKKKGIKEVWVELKDPQSETEFFAMAAIHNGQYSQWNPDGIAEMLMKYKGHPDIEDLHIALSHEVGVNSLLESYGPTDKSRELDSEKEEYNHSLDAYTNSAVRQIMLAFSIPQFEQFMSDLEELSKDLGGTKMNNTEAVIALMNFYKANK